MFDFLGFDFTGERTLDPKRLEVDRILFHVHGGGFVGLNTIDHLGYLIK